MSVTAWLGIILLPVLVLFLAVRKPPQAHPEATKPPIHFTPEEKAALKRDEQVMAVARELNERQGATPDSFAALMASMGAVEVPPVIYAVQIGNMALLKKALADGADVNEADHHGELPVIEAARQGNMEMVRLLIEQGADLDLRNAEGERALDVAMPEVQPYLRGH